MKYYDIRRILKEYPDAKYYMIIGERSNGKTYSSCDYALERYAKTGEQFAYVRRWGEDIRPKNLVQLFAAHEDNKRIKQLFNSRWEGVHFTRGKFVLTRYDDEEEEREYSDEPVGFAFDLNSMEHYKSISFPKVTTVIFDEFLSRKQYLPNEFILFTNALSTIIRNRANVKIIMLGNTVNKYSPYFSEMGLTHIKEQKQGTIDIYNYADSGLQVAVEYCSSTAKRGGKASDIYFAFDNPELQMITTGAWEISIYPHLPVGYKPKDVAGQFFVDFDGELLHGKIICVDNEYPFVFLHRKTTPIKDEQYDIVYGQEPSSKRTHMVGITRQHDKMSLFIKQALAENRIFYSENEVGEVFRNYLLWADSLGIKKA